MMSEIKGIKLNGEIIKEFSENSSSAGSPLDAITKINSAGKLEILAPVKINADNALQVNEITRTASSDGDGRVHLSYATFDTNTLFNSDVNINDALNVTGSLTVGRGLTVNSAANFNNTARFNNHAEFYSNVNIAGNTHAPTLFTDSIQAESGEEITVTGQLNFEHKVNFNGQDASNIDELTANYGRIDYLKTNRIQLNNTDIYFYGDNDETYDGDTKETLVIDTHNGIRLINSSHDAYGAKINFGDGNYVYLHEVNDDELTIHASDLIIMTSEDLKLDISDNITVDCDDFSVNTTSYFEVEASGGVSLHSLDGDIELKGSTVNVHIVGDKTSTISFPVDKSGTVALLSDISSTPANHASTDKTYGAGTYSQYGHVRLSSDSTTVSSAGNGTTNTAFEGAEKYQFISCAGLAINLNTFTREGKYTLYNVTGTRTSFPTNLSLISSNPTVYLEVRTFYGTSALHQTLYTRGYNEIWTRIYNGTSWTPWLKMPLGTTNGYSAMYGYVSGSTLYLSTQT